MVYGGAIPFQAARSLTVMPLSVAIRYRVWPRRTMVVTPGLGVETVTGPLSPARRTTRLLAQPASIAATSSATSSRAPRLIRPASSVRMPHKVADAGEQQHRGDPAQRFDPAVQRGLGPGPAKADRAGHQVHALAAADEHAGHERQQRHADDARGPGKELQRDRGEAGEHQDPERLPRRLDRDPAQVVHLLVDLRQPAEFGEQRLDQFE